MSRYPASTVAPFTLLVPIVGILTAWLVRGEHPAWGELIGSLIVLVGLTSHSDSSTHSARRGRPPPAQFHPSRNKGAPDSSSAAAADAVR
jgi:O-acetylserine/cysteine efflux transporter